MVKSILFGMLFLFVSVGNAQSFVATVDNNKVAENDRFELRFTFEGKNLNNLKNFNPPSLKEFKVLSGPNQSTSMQIINGVSSSSLTLSYILLPNTTGTYTIGSASIQSEDKTFTTDPIKINVVKGSQKPKDQSNSQVSNEEIAKNLFIRATIDKNKVYLGEQVTITYKLYTRLNIAAQMSVDKLPQYQGFWAEELETARNITFNREVIDGQQYSVGLLKRAALFPNQTGKLEVTPFELTIPIQVQKKKSQNNVWDDFFGDPFGRSEVVEYQAKSNTLKLDVIPLPENNKPSSFRGAVGRFDFDVSIDKQKTKTNEPITLKFNISGSGNIKLLELPPFELPNGFEKYDPKIEEQINKSGKISGTKKAEYLLIPRIAGSREIPAIEFSYFDPENKSYHTIKSKSFNVTIEQGQSTGNDIVNQQNINQLESDIRYIKTNYDDVEKQDGVLLLKPGFWIASITPLLAALVLIGWKRKQDKLSGNQQLLRYSKAEKVARKRFKTAKRLLDQNNVELFYSEISQALFGYLEDKFHIPKSEFTLDKAADELTRRNISADLVDKMKTNAQKCEFIRFAPSTNPAQAMNEMYNAFSAVVIDIERSITK
ncbi:MAG TPA: BatD family protein [Ignavibacteriaceae bacterium]|nr:BatD family protein [Ignavibacteriaceae bacterium]